jgi:hypothetical protein
LKSAASRHAWRSRDATIDLAEAPSGRAKDNACLRQFSLRQRRYAILGSLDQSLCELVTLRYCPLRRRQRGAVTCPTDQRPRLCGSDYEILKVAAHLEPTRLFDPADPRTSRRKVSGRKATSSITLKISPLHPAAAKRSPEFIRWIDA